MMSAAQAAPVIYAPLEWKRFSPTRYEAYGTDRTGTRRLRYAVLKERFGWCLHRYRAVRVSDKHHDTWVAEFQSKESVRNKQDGIAYANNLWRMAWGQHHNKER